MLGGRKVKVTLTGVTLQGSVAKGCPQRGTLTHSCEAWLKTNSKRDSTGMDVIHWDKCYPHKWKVPQLCLTASSGGFEYGTTVVG